MVCCGRVGVRRGMKRGRMKRGRMKRGGEGDFKRLKGEREERGRGRDKE